MKKRNRKFLALVLTVAIPGMSAFACSGTVWQQFRDALIQGAAGALQTAANNWVSDQLP
ncbi:MAG: hypothetical protein PVI86_04490 [Phycisphaerae bacterium]|jgi:hypothetical protein